MNERIRTGQTVLQLLRLALAGSSGSPQPPTGLVPCVAWEAVVSVASAHVVLPLLHEGVRALPLPGQVPDDAAAFLEQVHAANIERNRRLHAELVRVARSFNALGVTPLVMKGGAMLATDPDVMGSKRLMGDLDVLVPAERVVECARALLSDGYLQADEEYNGTEHHYPPLFSPCGRMGFDLHTRALQIAAGSPLPLEAVLAEARPVAIDGARLLVPSDRHRIVHVIAHAGISNHCFTQRRLMLRDLVDLSLLSRGCSSPVDWADIVGHFKTPSHRAGARAFLGAWARLLDEPQHDLPLGLREKVWMQQARWGFEGSRWHSLLTLPSDLALVLANPGGLRHVARTALRPVQVYRWITDRRGRGQGFSNSGAQQPR